MFEPLEQRRHCSVVNVTPANFTAAISTSNPGDTISFAAGNYAVQGMLSLPSNRTFVGNGAILNGGGQPNDVLSFANTTNVDFSGFVLNGIGPEASGADGLNFHDNVVENLNFNETGMQNSHVNNNSFTNSGIMGAPNSNDTFDNNNFDGCWEAIHMSGYGDVENTDVSGNVITHTTRFGIELQGELNNLTVDDNWLGDWDANPGSGHMGLSIATAEATNVSISGNTLLLTGDNGGQFNWTCACIETMGKNVTISDNYVYDWACFILNGSDPSGVTSSGNTIIGTAFSATDNVDYGPGPIQSSNDKIYALDDPNAPGWPTIASTTLPTAPAAPAASPVTDSSDVVRPTASAATTRATNPGTTTPTAVAATATKTAKAKKKKKKAAPKKATKAAKTDPDPILKSIVRIGT